MREVMRNSQTIKSKRCKAANTKEKLRTTHSLQSSYHSCFSQCSSKPLGHTSGYLSHLYSTHTPLVLKTNHGLQGCNAYTVKLSRSLLLFFSLLLPP